MNTRVSYLKLIQNVISRFANNSFIIKGWTITLVAALIAIIGKDVMTDKIFLLFICIPAFLFWFLDGYYLSLERRNRNLYEHARKLTEEEIDFSLDTKPYKSPDSRWINAVFSKTLLLYYGAILIALILLFIFLK